MSAVSFDQLPDDARVWVFAASRPLSEAESAPLLRGVDGFIDGWAAHGSPVRGARDWRHERFLLVGADERATGVSGCSIDSLFHALAAAEADTGVRLRDSSLVFFRDPAGEIRTVPRPEFRRLAAAGEVTGDTPVFDNTVTTAGDIRSGRWETRLRDAWHARAFPIAR
jgi:hypothetical protein